MNPVNDHEVARRTVLKAGAWAAPAVAVAVATPLAAASTAPDPCVFNVILNATPSTDNPITLQATNSRNEIYTVLISSTVSATTTVGQDVDGEFREFNLSRSGTGIAGEYLPDGSADYVFSGFGPAGAIVLNQRTSTVDGDSSTPVPGATDAQTLTFTFFDPQGALITAVRDVQIDIFDISSVDQPQWWRSNYWDAVGFSTQPTSIVASGPYSTGAGLGTTADPYRRANGNSPTTSAGQIEDTFSFATFSSGSTMTYTQYGNRQGWHFASISRLQFTLDECR